MNIHEYQAKALFQQEGIPVPRGFLATTAIEAEFAYRRLKSPVAVVKAQIHAGGRGKGGGVKLVKDANECSSVAEKMLAMTLITPQTGAEGKKVSKVYIEAGSEIAKEYYLAVLVDRETTSIALMFSTEGGMDIEEVAEKSPEKIITVHIDPNNGVKNFHITQIASSMNLPKEETKELGKFIRSLYKMFRKYDCSLLEINPLIVNKQGEMLALDAKLNFDDNSLYRHPRVESLRDFNEEDLREIEASKFGLSYIGLEGNIGCLVNGAGLAMATMDIIKHYGGDPANFLDVGGGATEEQVKNAFRIILQDKNVQAIFVNIFGGIMKCDIIAKGIVAACKELSLTIPLVVRLEGTNVKEGREILNSSNVTIISAQDMADGAQKVVKLLK